MFQLQVYNLQFNNKYVPISSIYKLQFNNKCCSNFKLTTNNPITNLQVTKQQQICCNRKFTSYNSMKSMFH